MPSDTLLLKFGIDTQPVNQAMAAIRSGLLALQQVSNDLKNTVARGASDVGVALGQIQAALKQNVAASHEAQAAEKAKLTVAKEQSAEYTKHAAALGGVVNSAKQALEAERLRKAELQSATQELARQTAEHRAMTAEIQKQMAEIRRQRLEQAGERGGGGRGGQLLGQITKGVFGTGLAGGIAGGVIAGEGIAAVIEGLGEMIQKFKELLDKSSKLTVLEDTFEQLAKGAGADANKMLGEMQEKTSGLVTRFELMRVANTAMRSPLGLNSQQIAELTGDVAKLAAAAGKSVPDAIERLNQGLERGRLQTVATATGISTLELTAANIPPTLNRAERAAFEFSYALRKLHEEASNLKEIANVEDVVRRLSVSVQDLFMEFGRGVNISAGFRLMTEGLDGVAASLRNTDQRAKDFGEALGNALIIVIPVLNGIKNVLGEIFGLVGDVAREFQALFGIHETGLGDTLIGLDELLVKFVGTIEIAVRGVRGLFAALREGAKGTSPITSEESGEFQGFAQDTYNAAKAANEEMHASQQAQIKRMKAAADKTGNPAAQKAANEAVLNEDRRYHAASIAAWNDYQKQLTQIQQALNASARIQEIRSKSGFIISSSDRAQLKAAENDVLDFRQTLVRTIEAGDDLQRKLTKSFEQVDKASELLGHPVKGGAIAKRSTLDDDNLKEQEKLLQDRDKLSKDQMERELKFNQLSLAAQQALIEKRRERDAQAYANGDESLQDHLAHQIALEKESSEDESSKAIQDNAAKARDLRRQSTVLTERRKLNLISGPDEVEQQKDINLKLAGLATELGTELVKIATQTGKKVADLQMQGTKDAIAAEAKRIDATIALEAKQTQALIEEIAKRKKASEEAVQNDQKLNEKKFGRGAITPEQYYKNQQTDIQKLMMIEVQAATETANAKLAQAQRVVIAAETEAGIKQKSGMSTEEEQNKEARGAQEVAAAAQALDQAQADAHQKALERQEVLDQDYAQKRLASLKNFGMEQQAIQAQLGMRQQFGPGSGQPSEGALMAGMLKSLRSEQANLIKQANDLTAQMTNGATGLDDIWFQIYDRVQKTQMSIDDFTEKMREATSVGTALGQAFGMVGDQMSKVFANEQSIQYSRAGGVTRAYTRPALLPTIAEGLQGGGAALAASAGLGRTISGKGAPLSPEMQALQDQANSLFDTARAAATTIVDPANRAAAALNKVAEAADKLSGGPVATGALSPGSTGVTTQQIIIGAKVSAAAPGSGGDFGGETAGASGGGKSFPQAIHDWTQRIQAAATAVTSFASTIMNAKNAASGAIGGGLSGAGLGSALGQGLQSVSSLAPIIGPIVGAAFGAIMGGIVGNKQQQIQTDLQNFSTQMQNIMFQFSLNTNNLQQTIIQLEVLRSAVQAEAGSTKKGKGAQAFTQQINQLNQQIQQLQAQQNQVLVTMKEQLAVLVAPQGAQQYLTTLQQIVEQYNQFAGAAQNTNQLAQANEFLVRSLQSYATTLETTLAQDNQTAINQALQLNDLYVQRIDLVNQMNTQIESVLSAGVLSRTPTRAMTAGQQIEQIQFQGQNQLDQINEQIAADQHAVQSQQQIFQLATTRIGLEMQLLQLQNAQNDVQTTTIAALAQIVHALQSGNFSSLASLLASVPGYTNPSTGVATPSLTSAQLSALIASVVGGSGGVPGQSGMDALTAIFASAYQSYASMGMGSYRGQNL